MNKRKREMLYAVILYFINVLSCWILISTTIQVLKCPKMTQTEIFLHIPKSFMCNWTECI